MLFCEGKERFGGFFGYERQVDVYWGEGPLVGPAEQEQCFGEVDRPGVDDIEALDKLAGVAVQVIAGHVEKCLGDRQRGAQFVGGVGGEPLLLGDVGFEPGEHGVEGVGELAELVFAALQPDPVGERPGRGDAGGVCDASQGGQHPAGEEPPSQQTEHQQERQHCGCPRCENVQEVGPDRKNTMNDGGADERTLGDVTQEEHPHGGEQQGAREHEEPRVAEGQPEANAQTRGSIHDLLPWPVPASRLMQ